MADVQTVWAGTTGDYAFEAGDALGGGELRTAILISLFTDARARDDDRLPDDRDTDPRGWWGEMFEQEDAAGPFGSRLWLLAREKQTTETLTRAEHYAAEALEWLIGDGIATAVTVRAAWIARGVMALNATIVRPDLTSETWQFDWAWREETANAA